MATATGLTAAKMHQLANENIVGGLIDLNGHLLLQRRDETTVDAGDIWSRWEQLGKEVLPIYRDESGFDSEKPPSFYPVGKTLQQATEGGLPSLDGLVETVYIQPNIARQTLYERPGSSRVWSRGANVDVWGPWRLEGVTVGEIGLFAGATAPWGAVICDGAAISRVDYSSLFDVIGTTYGAGDGSTTFNLPNFKGRVPVGRDAADSAFDVLGETGGAKTHTLTQSEMPRHDHAVRPLNDTATALRVTDDGYGLASGTSYRFAIHTTTTNASRLTAHPSGSDAAHNNLQPYMAVNYIIWY